MTEKRKTGGEAVIGTTDRGKTGRGTADEGMTGSGTADEGMTDSGTTDSGTAGSGATDSRPTDGGTAGHYYTYMLRCADGTLYTGWTVDLERRLKAHNRGTGSRYTRSRRPVELAWYEEQASREEAMSREWHIKRLTRQQKERLIES